MAALDASASKTHKARVEELSIRLTNTLNTRDFSDPVFDVISPECVARHDAGLESANVEGRAQFVEQWKAMLEHMPHATFRIYDVVSTVNSLADRATVYVIRNVSGAPDGLEREVVTEYTWARLNEEWSLIKVRSLRSFPQYETEAVFGKPVLPWTDLLDR